MFLATVQVGAVPVRKDDEVTVVRGTYKVHSPLFHEFALHNLSFLSPISASCACPECAAAASQPDICKLRMS